MVRALSGAGLMQSLPVNRLVHQTSTTERKNALCKHEKETA
jgi:hypothetical protein